MATENMNTSLNWKTFLKKTVVTSVFPISVEATIEHNMIFFVLCDFYLQLYFLREVKLQSKQWFGVFSSS